MGKRLARRMLVMVRRAGDQRSTGPSGEADQSLARMSAPISPPPRKHAHSAPEAVGRISAGTSSIEVKLGRWSEAWDRLRGLDPLAAAFPIARAGLSQQRAWIAAHTGRASEALHHWHRAELGDLPGRYHAEHFFTGAVAQIASRDLQAAQRCAQAGGGAAGRVSSRRNALTICGRGAPGGGGGGEAGGA